jgi:dTDP-3-amino-3,4,6-trideoxy-alpha-D-glucose transaminase
MSKQVPYFSFDSAPRGLKSKWKSAVADVINDGHFIGGYFVSKFESDFGKFMKCKNVVGVGNGLDGLAIALKSLGVGKGDTVVVPAHTFIACWLAIEQVGATPVGVDVDENGLIELDELESISPTPRAVIPVHLHGAMVDMERLTNWAEKFGVLVIEDASQAHGASQNGVLSGAWGDAGVFSLYPSKNLGAAGDAGVIIFRNSQIAEVARSIRSYGSNPEDKYDHVIAGMNSRLDPIQAAILSVNLTFLESWNNTRIAIAELYSSQLDGKIQILQDSACKSVRHHFPILVAKPQDVSRFLQECGIGTERHYPKLASSEYFRINQMPDKYFKKSDFITSRTLSLPISPWHTFKEIEYVCETLNLGLRKGLIKA